MDIASKNESEAEKRNEQVMNYQSPNISSEWKLSGAMVDSFCPTTWDQPTSSWTPSSNAMLKGGMFLAPAPMMLPQSLAQFPAHSGFIERAARFSCFSGGNFSDMMNPFSIPDPYYRGLAPMQAPQKVLKSPSPVIKYEHEGKEDMTRGRGRSNKGSLVRGKQPLEQGGSSHGGEQADMIPESSQGNRGFVCREDVNRGRGWSNTSSLGRRQPMGSHVHEQVEITPESGRLSQGSVGWGGDARREGYLPTLYDEQAELTPQSFQGNQDDEDDTNKIRQTSSGGGASSSRVGKRTRTHASPARSVLFQYNQVI